MLDSGTPLLGGVFYFKKLIMDRKGKLLDISVRKLLRYFFPLELPRTFKYGMYR